VNSAYQGAGGGGWFEEHLPYACFESELTLSNC